MYFRYTFDKISLYLYFERFCSTAENNLVDKLAVLLTKYNNNMLEKI